MTRGPGPHGSPSWGRDGTLYYVAGGNGAANVWQVRINPQTGEAAGPPTQVTFYLDASVGQLARAGSGLGFTLIRSTPTIYRAETSAPQRPTPVARGGQPVLSPDGSTVYFVRARPHAEENGPVALHAVTPADGAIRTLADNVLATSGSGLPGYDLSTDGRTIAYTGADQSGHAIFTVSTSGGSPRVIARLEDNGEITPRFSPDGSQIGYADGKNLYLASTTGGAPRQIARLEAGFEGWSLRWSPNGRQIAVFGYPGATSAGNNVAFVLSADGTGGLRQVGTLDDYKESLQWDPAGARLIYHLSRRNSSTVQIPAAGGSESLFHDAPGVWDYRGIWAPDGRAYFFEVAPDNSPTWEVWRLDARSGSSARFAGNGPSLPSFSRDGRMMTWREAPTVGELWLIDNLP